MIQWTYLLNGPIFPFIILEEMIIIAFSYIKKHITFYNFLVKIFQMKI